MFVWRGKLILNTAWGKNHFELATLWKKLKLSVRFKDVRVINKKAVYFTKKAFLDSCPTWLSFAGQSSHFHQCQWYKTVDTAKHIQFKLAMVGDQKIEVSHLQLSRIEPFEIGGLE